MLTIAPLSGRGLLWRALLLGVLSRGTRSGLFALGLCWRGVRGEMPLSPTILGTCVLDGGAFSSIPSVLENWTRPLGRVAANKATDYKCHQ